MPEWVLDWIRLIWNTGLRYQALSKGDQKEEALESLGEELRVLYVTLTRAKETNHYRNTFKSRR